MDQKCPYEDCSSPANPLHLPISGWALTEKGHGSSRRRLALRSRRSPQAFFGARAVALQALPRNPEPLLLRLRSQTLSQRRDGHAWRSLEIQMLDWAPVLRLSSQVSERVIFDDLL